ncbi:MAG: glycosyltransferase [Nitrospiraceae bacterium]|nr:glycosyltransferase [Nitrospiraceae bacterium]
MASDRTFYIERVKGTTFIALLSIGVTAYYLIWRLNTFNPGAMGFSIVLYSAEVYGFITTLMFFFMIWKPKKRLPIAPEQGLTVGVFIPTLNEDVELLRKTVLGCLNMTYPHKTYILDDGRRQEVETLAGELGCGYIARPDNKDAKAGNLNYALSRTDGEFVVIFDADHVPQPDFLDKVLGYFRDRRVAFVQTPQDFYNIDSFQHRLTRNKKLWTEQSLFFSLIQPGKDKWNAAFFCGSCAVLRRKALEDIGGFATGTVTEDLHTSIKLHAGRWKSIYHNESLAYGIAAPVLYPFKCQRLRWGQGAMQVLIRDNPVFIKGLTFPQRICYLASIITYFDGFQKAVYYISPIIVLLTGLYPIKAFNMDFLIRFIPHLGLSLWAYEEMTRGFGRIFLMEQYNMIRFNTFIKSTTGFFKNKKLRFKVTPKTGFERTHIRMLIPQALILSVGILSIFWTISGLAPYKVDRGVIAANIFWALINTGLAYTAGRYALRKVQRRKDFRFPANLPALAVFPNPGSRLIVVEDLHEKGASTHSQERFKAGSTLTLRLPLAHRTVEIKGRVLYSKEGSDRGIPIFHHGIEFEEVSGDARDAIVMFNFSYAVNKMMNNLSIAEETPLLKLQRMLRGTVIQKRGVRHPLHLPGDCWINAKEHLPFVTEDISDYGMRIFTYHEIREPFISFDLVSHNGWPLLKGRIIWRKGMDFHGNKAWQYGVKFLIETEKVVHKEVLGGLVHANA